MKCFACHTEIEEGRARCQICGFPIIQNVDGGSKEIDSLHQMRKDYLEKKLDGVSIGITAYSYIMENDELKMNKATDIVLAQAQSLEFDKPLWYKQDFARVETDESVMLSVFVKYKDKKTQTHELKIKFPKINGFCHIGIVLKEGLTVQFMLGNEDTHVFSEPICLLDK